MKYICDHFRTDASIFYKTLQFCCKKKAKKVKKCQYNGNTIKKM